VFIVEQRYIKYPTFTFTFIFTTTAGKELLLVCVRVCVRVRSDISEQERMSAFTADHSDVTVGQLSQRDVTASRPGHRGMSVEDPRLRGPANHAVAALFPAGKAGNGPFRCDGSFEKQTGVELLRAGYGARAWVGDDDDGGIPQYNDVRRPAARPERAVYVEYERSQRASRRPNDAEDPRQIYHQLSRLFMFMI